VVEYMLSMNRGLRFNPQCYNEIIRKRMERDVSVNLETRLFIVL
jgi:hypothetical protein